MIPWWCVEKLLQIRAHGPTPPKAKPPERSTLRASITPTCSRSASPATYRDDRSLRKRAPPFAEGQMRKADDPVVSLPPEQEKLKEPKSAHH